MKMQSQIPKNMNRMIIIINWFYPILWNSEILHSIVIQLFQFWKISLCTRPLHIKVKYRL